MLSRTELIPVYDGERRQIGPFDCEFIPVTHSVPHAFATAYHTPAGTILHSGDFKLDLTPVDGRRPTSPASARSRRAAAAIRLLLSDSTNAERPGFTPSESTVGAAMRDAVPRPPGQALHRRELRLAPPPRAAGRGGGARRPGARSRSSAGRWCRTSRWRARWACSTCPSDRVIDIDEVAELRARRGLRHLHGIAGRADERAGADGRARAQVREGQRRRRRRDLRPRDPGQRVERVPCDRRAAPRRRRGRARPARAGARVGSRVAGGAEVPAQPRPARVVRPRARRVPPHRATTPAWREAVGRRARERVSSARTATSLTSATPGVDVERRRGAGRLPSTSTGSSATSASACCATAATWPRKVSWS